MSAQKPLTCEEILKFCREPAYSLQQDEGWQNEVAEDLNQILVRVQWTLETMGEETEVDLQFARAAVRIAQRVTEFEKILT